jgi:hypothetical protein
VTTLLEAVESGAFHSVVGDELGLLATWRYETQANVAWPA